MDLAHFGLRRRPFRPAPDLYFPAVAHAAAADRLREAFDSGDGLALLDGGPGTGKTLVAVRFLDALGPAAVPVFLPSAKLAGPADFHQALLFDLGKPYRGISENELRLAVTEYWLGELAAGRRGAVVLDEAHHLTPAVLEEVRLLDNLEARGAKAVFTLLVGPPELRESLAATEALSQRVGCRVHLGPLGEEEAVAYLRHQLAACGGKAERLLPDEAAALVAVLGRGVPRLLNQLAGAALGFAGAAGEKCLDVEAVYAAAEELGLPTEPAGPEFSAPPAESGAGEEGQDGEADEPGPARGPKQKARRRRAA